MKTIREALEERVDVDRIASPPEVLILTENQLQTELPVRLDIRNPHKI